MWYERIVSIIGFNIIVLSLMYLSIIFNIWLPYTAMSLAILMSVYNSLVSYNRAIDKTVDSLAKHYEKQLMEEIKKAVDKAMGK